MDTTHPTTAPRRGRRPLAGLLAVVLALIAGFAAASAAPAAADPLPAGLTWKLSEQAFTSSSLAPAHATAAPATKTADGFSFPQATDVSVDAFTGAVTATFPGSFDLGNTNQGNYRIRIASPTLTIPAGRATGTLTAAVSYALAPAAPTDPHVFTAPVDAVVANLTFAPGAVVDTGSNLSFTATPEFVLRTDLTPENNPNGFRQHPQPFLDALDPQLISHFRETNTGQPAKAPSPVSISLDYTPNDPPEGLTWRMSQQAWASSSLSPAHATGAPATKTDRGFSFPEASRAVYDPETGEGQIDFTGSFDLGNTNQGNYRIRIADPTILLNGDGTGYVDAAVSYALAPAQPGDPHVFTTPGRVPVATLTLPEGSITVDGDQLSFIVRPDFVLRTDLTPENNPNGFRQHPQAFLDALDPQLISHFRETNTGQPAKAPSPVGVNVAFELPDPNVAFVEALYSAVLDRGPGEGERDYWTGKLAGGTNQDVVGKAVAGSLEARRRLVVIDYAAALDRGAAASEVDYWAGRLGSGLTPETLLTQLLASPEALTVWGGTPEGLAEAGYGAFLLRSGDPAGLTYWGGRLAAANGAGGRRSVLTSFGRTQAATTAAVTQALGTACGTVPSLDVSERVDLEHIWWSTGKNPLRLTAAAVSRQCPEGPVEG